MCTFQSMPFIYSLSTFNAHKQMEEQILWWLCVSDSAGAWHSVLWEPYWHCLLWILILFIKAGHTLFNPVTLPPLWKSTTGLSALIENQQDFCRRGSLCLCMCLHVCSSDCRAYFVNQEVLRLSVTVLKTEKAETSRWTRQMGVIYINAKAWIIALLYIWDPATLQLYSYEAWEIGL